MGDGCFYPSPLYTKKTKMTNETGKIVFLSSKDWTGIITIVITVTGIMIGCYIQSIRMVERLDAIVSTHDERIDRLETQRDKENH